MVDQRADELDLRLVRGQILPRWRQVVRTWETLIAAVPAILLASFSQFLPSAELPIDSIAYLGFTFAAISTGAGFSAIILSLCLPGADRLHRWSNQPGTLENKSALSDLVFVLVWSTLIQVSLVACCALATAFGGDLSFAPPGMSNVHRISIGAGMFVFFYAIVELVIVVQTLCQVGVVIIAEERDKVGDLGER